MASSSSSPPVLTLLSLSESEPLLLTLFSLPDSELVLLEESLSLLKRRVGSRGSLSGESDHPTLQVYESTCPALLLDDPLFASRLEPPNYCIEKLLVDFVISRFLARASEGEVKARHGSRSSLWHRVAWVCIARTSGWRFVSIPCDRSLAARHSPDC